MHKITTYFSDKELQELKRLEKITGYSLNQIIKILLISDYKKSLN